MPSVTVEREIHGVSVTQVWEIARDIERYPLFMDQVISVTRREVGNADVSSWVVLFNGNELRWQETDTYDHAGTRMAFAQIEGDLAEWRGTFLAMPTSSGVLARYEVYFDLGIPALADLLHPLGEGAIASNCSQMLEQIDLLAHQAEPQVRNA